MKTSTQDPLSELLEPVVARIASQIARMVAERVRDEFAGDLAGGAARKSGRHGAGRLRATRRPRRRGELKRWVTDVRARRVPTFVIEATGLDTKRKLVAKYGANAVFEKGKPLPKPAAGSASK
jgi:hypothetical protein